MEPLTQTTVVAIQDQSQVALARRTATEFANIAGLDEQRTSAANIVAVELANNLLQHAGSGQIYFSFSAPSGSFEIVAVDHGRGMTSVNRCLEDGFSTSSTPGLGLGAVQRFASRFGAFSVPNRTTVVSAQMTDARPQFDFGVICIPIQGETLSGDSWAVSEDGSTFLVVDGLGHGIFASDASRMATSIFLKHQSSTPKQLLEMMHSAMRSTRGAAAAIAQINRTDRKINFAGIGNIGCMIVGQERNQSLVSHNGTLGHQMRRVQEFQYSYQPSDVLLMQSDGLTTQSKQGIPPLLMSQPPSVIAAFLFSEQLRGRDDATLLVNRLG